MRPVHHRGDEVRLSDVDARVLPLGPGVALTFSSKLSLDDRVPNIVGLVEQPFFSNRENLWFDE